ncbi:hypothetical protein [Achromobacter sp. KK8]|jgi:hypothetical protein
MTKSYDVAHGLSQCPPGSLEPVEIAQQPGAAPATGNTARDQEMYVAGIRTGEENAKHNAAIRAGAGWLPIESAPKDGTEFQAWLNVGLWEPRCRFNPDSEAFEIWGRVDYDRDDWDACGHLTASHWMPKPAAPGVSTVEDAQDGVPADVMAALNRMCTPLDASILKGATADADAFCMQLIRDYILRRPAPAAGDALDAERYRAIRNPPYSDRYGDLYAMTFQGDGDIPLKGDELDAAADAAIAAQRKGDA